MKQLGRAQETVAFRLTRFLSDAHDPIDFDGFVILKLLERPSTFLSLAFSAPETDEQPEPEDIFFDSLGPIFDLKPMSVGSMGSSFVYRYHGIEGSRQYTSHTITLDTPDTKASNWHLHASAIWVSSIYLADNISGLEIPPPSYFQERASSPFRVLELGASAGLPGILISKLFPDASVTVSDYPDEALIDTLSHNVNVNNVSNSCRVVPYAWGTDPSPLVRDDGGFDIVIAADTLWNPDLHQIFVETLTKTLKQTPSSRIHLIAGLHTGRYTIRAVLGCAETMGLEIESIVECEANGSTKRPWCVSRDEGDQERRRWVVWATLKWAFPQVYSNSLGEGVSRKEQL